MSRHPVAIQWRRTPHPLDGRTYSRNHVTSLNGQEVIVSASAKYKGDPDCADPEQMLVSAVASCHMLTFLAVAELHGYRVEQFDCNAVGFLENADGAGMSITRVELSPTVRFGGAKVPDAAMLSRIHAGAHRNCFIANSLKCAVTVLPCPAGA